MDKFKLSKKAQFDLTEIWDYTKYRWSKKQANKYLILLLNKFEYISKNSGIGKSCNSI